MIDPLCPSAARLRQIATELEAEGDTGNSRELWCRALAAQFAHNLRELASDPEWETMRQANRAHHSDGICASHDFCDANMPMADAFESVFGYAPFTLIHMGARRFCSDFDTDASERQQERDCGLWNTAWDIAKREYLTAPIEEKPGAGPPSAV